VKKQLGQIPILFPMPALLVGTFDDDGTANAMCAAWSSICCQRPPCVGVAIRTSRLTYKNIVERRVFTLNVPTTRMATEVDYLGTVSGRDEPEKVHTAGLEVVPGHKVDAPIIVDCPVNLECVGRNKLDIGSHTWVIGEIIEVHVDEHLVDRQGKVDVTALDPLIYCPSVRTYHGLGEQVGRAFHDGQVLVKK
jgi:flavin reductase (DIM6/NTAB) family NADH-FMN oxidoreductase RutF